MGLVKSVEHFEFDLNYTTFSGSYPLTKSQDTSYCVPFFTVRAEHHGTYYHREWLPRVEFEDNKVVTQAYFIGGTAARQTLVSVNVVEFDSAYANVQTGTFNLTAGVDTNTTVSGVEFNSVDLDKTFLMFNYNYDYAGTVWRGAMVKGSFSNSESIYFTRQASLGDVYGRWYTVEAVNNSFFASGVDINALSGSARGYGHFSEYQNPNKSFLICSYELDNAGSNDTDYYAITSNLVGPTAVEMRRSNTSGAINSHIFRVTLNGPGQRVQRQKLYNTATDASYMFDIDESDTELLTPHIPTFFGINYSSDDDTDDIPRAFHQIALLDDNDVCQTAGGTVTSYGVTNPNNLFDGDTGTGSTISGAMSAWVQYEFPTATGINNMMTHITAAGTFPFQLDASNTGSFSGEEVTLLNRTNTSFSIGYNDYPFENKNSYKYYRFINNHTVTNLPLNSIEFYAPHDTATRVAVNKKYAKASNYNFEVINWKEYTPYVETKQSSTTTPVLSVENLDMDSGTSMINSTELSKGQNPDYCVPFLTCWQETAAYRFSGYLSNVYFTEDGNLPKLILNKRDKGPRTHSNVSVVEFDPAEVKVQQGAFGFNGLEVSTTVSGSDVIDSFDRNKTFLIFNYETAYSATTWRIVMLKGYLPNDNSITFERQGGSGGGDITGTWYLVECIGDWFDVEWIEHVGAAPTDSMYKLLDNAVLEHKTFLTGSYSLTNAGAADTDYYAQMIHLYNPKEILLRRHNGANIGYGDFSIFIVSFKEDHITPYVDRSYRSVGTADSEFNFYTYDYSTNYVTAKTGTFFGITPSSDDDADDTSRAFFKCTASGINSTEILLERKFGKSAYIVWELIDWGAPVLPTHHFAGDVKEIEDPVERTVRAYRADTGELVGSTTSVSGTGAFDVTTTYSGAHYVVCLDDPEGVDYNDLIYGSVTPDAI